MQPLPTNSQHTPVKTQQGRYAFLDVLRAIAAVFVLLQHALNAEFKYMALYYFNPGIFGVGLFFLVSGFIIPVSLERKNSLKKFWINRLFRIYPLFVFSLLVTLITIYFRNPLHFPSFQTIILQVLFILHFITGDSIVYLYWTLSLEMLFYIVLSVVFYLGYIQKSTLLAGIMLGISFFTGSILIGYLHIGAGSGLIFYLATMFVGTLYYRYINCEIKLKTLIIMVVLALLVFISNSALVLLGSIHTSFGGKGFLTVVNSTVLAYLVFSLIFWLRDKKFPGFLLYLGTISYSIYLIQGNVLTLIRGSGNSLLTATVQITATLIIAGLTYRFIERPFIKLGHKLANRTN